MALPAEKPRYTFADVLTWDEDERVEIIDGEPTMMAPAPARVHQEVSGSYFDSSPTICWERSARSTPLRLPSVCLNRMETARRMWTPWWSRTSP